MTDNELLDKILEITGSEKQTILIYHVVKDQCPTCKGTRDSSMNCPDVKVEAGKSYTFCGDKFHS